MPAHAARPPLRRPRDATERIGLDLPAPPPRTGLGDGRRIRLRRTGPWRTVLRRPGLCRTVLRRAVLCRTVLRRTVLRRGVGRRGGHPGAGLRTPGAAVGLPRTVE